MGGSGTIFFFIGHSYVRYKELPLLLLTEWVATVHGVRNRVNIGKLGRIEIRPRTVAIDRYIHIGFSHPATINW